MSEAVKAIAGIGFLAAIGIFVHTQAAEQKIEVIAHYQLNDTQVALMAQCDDSLDRYDKRFKGGASDTVGCACIASELGKAGALTPTSLDGYGEVLNLLISHAPGDDETDMDMVGFSTGMMALTKVTPSEAMGMAMSLADTVEVCKSARLPRDGGQTTADAATQSGPKTKGTCAGMNEATLQRLREIGGRQGKTLQQMCENVVTH